tara:strand:+ start:119 stop:472 length:354 start_codon:yes stop_codon:yes gene_type:complete
MANIKKPKSKTIDKGMTTRASAKAMELGRRKKAYDTSKKATAKARAHVMSVMDSHKKKPDSSGKKRVLKAANAFSDIRLKEKLRGADYFELQRGDNFKKPVLAYRALGANKTVKKRK